MPVTCTRVINLEMALILFLFSSDMLPHQVSLTEGHVFSDLHKFIKLHQAELQ